MNAPAFDADDFLTRLWAQDAVLVQHGFHAVSPWWRREITRFVRALAAGDTDKAAALIRRWIVRAGRRGGKSSTLCRLAVCWALYGAWHVPAGDIAVVAFVSVNKDEASARLRTIAAILDVLGMRYEPRDAEIELTGDRPVLFKVFAATTRATVGFTAIMIIGDEVARWESRDTAANPAQEVFSSLFPTLASQLFGFAVLCSSPWGSDDYHAQRFDEGDTDSQLVSFAPTWIANPEITEERTHQLEPDERLWAREYAAEPGTTISNAFDPADIAACFDGAPRGRLSRAFVATDPSSLRGDAFTWIAGRETTDAEIVVGDVGGWSGDELRRVSMADVVESIAARAHRWNCSVVFGDQREEAALRSLYAQQRTGYVSYAWTEQSKDTAVMRLRRMMRERKLFLCEHAVLRREITNLKARLMPSGRVKYESNGLDYVSALITLAHAVIDNKILTGSDAPVVTLPDPRRPRPLGPRPQPGAMWGGRPYRPLGDGPTRADRDWREFAEADRRRRLIDS